MQIKSIHFLEDRIRVYYHLGKPWGIPDVDASIDVFYDSIHKLPEVPKNVGAGCRQGEDIIIPQLGRTITFVFDTYMERPVGPPEEDMRGPYLKK
ncbi:hypothetical protein HYS31_04210 [Candidatus Woesearchaeota archaeon]|nr:hypothetical protein [Candidatus Woesearchaeota archaeon]